MVLVSSVSSRARGIRARFCTRRMRLRDSWRWEQREASMRGSDMRTGELFSYVDLEERVPRDHPLRPIRGIVNEVLAALDREFAALCATDGRPSIAPERLLRVMKSRLVL